MPGVHCDGLRVGLVLGVTRSVILERDDFAARFVITPDAPAGCAAITTAGAMLVNVIAEMDDEIYSFVVGDNFIGIEKTEGVI